MKILRVAATAVALLVSLNAGVLAQTTLRIGLAEDPDMLDPTLGRTYVGRIVFASFCDKLFDIDEKLNIVPQLALSHQTSDDGKEMTIKLRPGVKFHDGEPFDAEAAKFSIDRHLTFPTSFRKPELATVDHVDVVDPLTIKLVLKTPFSPLIAQLTDRAGMMVSPKAAKEAGDKFGLKPVCAGPYKFVERVQQDRIVFEKFADYWNKDNVFIDRIVYLPIVDATVRLANLKSGGLDLIERVLATDIKDVRADSRLKLSTALELGYFGLTLNVNNDKNKGALSQSAKVRQALDLSFDREAINQVVFNGEFKPAISGSVPNIPITRRLFRFGTRHRQGQGAFEGSRRHPACRRRHDGAQGRRERGRRPGAAVDGVGSGLRPENPPHRVCHLVQAGPGRRISGLPDRLERPDRSRRQFLCLPARQGAAERRRLFESGSRQGARRGAPVTDPAQRKAIYEKLTKIVLEDMPLIYLYHRKLLIAHTTKLEGYKQMPDGLVRVIGLKLK